jgi:REP element-mobilizing transposase RayT
MASNYDLLIPNNYYHIYNRAVGSEQMFLSEENYYFFLQKHQLYINAIATVYAYCLMPNHFHFFVKIQNEQSIAALYQEKKKRVLPSNTVLVSEFIMEQYSNFFNSYTKSFNKVYNRKGKLFMDHLKRKQIDDAGYYTKIIQYIHFNPIKHGLTNSVGDWKFSSYKAMVSEAPTSIDRNEILDWFGGKEAFIKFHNRP